MAIGNIEKQLRKEVRKYHIEGEELYLVDTKTVESKVCKVLLKNILKERINITFVPQNTKKRKNVFIPSSLENELVRELQNFLEDKHKENEFSPLLATVPESLILEFAKRHNISGKTLAQNLEVRAMLEKLQNGQAQTKAALRKSFAWLKEHTKTRSEHL